MALGREFSVLSKLSNANSFFKISSSGSLQNPSFLLSVRTSKHWDPKWKWLRSQKIKKVELPDYDDKAKSKEKMRTRLKELGLMPPRYWRNRPMTITTTNEIIDPYVPPVGDGKASILSKEGVLDLASSLNKKKDSMLAIRKIKTYDSQFDVKIFPQIAQDIYIKAHETLMSQDPEKLSEFVTDKANQEMLSGLKLRTLRWKFIESLEPPVVVHARAEAAINKTNFFAQVTVRFHSKQSLAIYDRFGRLYYGSEVLAKDVLEYVVFENHIVHEYGTWRLHAKIIPDWGSVKDPIPKTYRVEEDIAEEDDEDEFVEEDQTEENIAETEIVKKESESRA